MKVTVSGTTRANGSIVLAVLGACFLVVMMDNTILNVALQSIQVELGATNSELQWAVDSYILIYASLMFSAGVLADRFGRRRVLLIGLAIFGVASALSAWASTPQELILWRGVMAIGGAVVPPATLAIINNTFPEEERGKAIGIWSAIGGLSIAFGPIIGGFLLEHFWWGSVFLINIPVVVICATLMFVVVPESRSSVRRRPDFAGVLLSILGTGTLVYGVIRGGDTNDWLGAEVAGSLAAAVVLIAAMLWYEQRVDNPALDVRLFSRPAFSASIVGSAVSFFALTGGTFFLVFYVQGILGHSPLELGLILLPTAAGTVISAILSSGLAKKFGVRATVAAGLLLLVVSFAWLYTLERTTPLWQLEIILTLSGAGLGLVMGTTTTSIMSMIPADKGGAGAAVNNTLRQVGAAIGVAALGSALSLRYRAELGAATDALPAQLRAQADDSLGSTTRAVTETLQRPELAAEFQNQAGAVITQAHNAFIQAMHTSALIGAGALALGFLVALLWLPGRDLPRPAAHSASQIAAPTEETAINQ